RKASRRSRCEPSTCNYAAIGTTVRQTNRRRRGSQLSPANDDPGTEHARERQDDEPRSVPEGSVVQPDPRREETRDNGGQRKSQIRNDKDGREQRRPGRRAR